MTLIDDKQKIVSSTFLILILNIPMQDHLYTVTFSISTYTVIYYRKKEKDAFNPVLPLKVRPRIQQF